MRARGLTCDGGDDSAKGAEHYGRMLAHLGELHVEEFINLVHVDLVGWGVG